jgi:hypothetical protein
MVDAVMSKNSYPEIVYYFEQLITSKISLKAEFKIERLVMRQLAPTDAENKYITKELQDPYIVRYSEEDSLFTDVNDEVLDGEYNFVLTCEENPILLCSEYLHHSYLSNGKKVLGVGTLSFDQGQLKIITNDSGHYRPTDEELLPIIKAFYTASNGTLFKYKSFCNSVVSIYPVAELLSVNSFDAVKPLALNEDVLPESGIRIISDYDNMIQSSSLNCRFGRDLSSELSIKYSKFLECGVGLFNGSVQSIENKENVDELSIEGSLISQVLKSTLSL